MLARHKRKHVLYESDEILRVYIAAKGFEKFSVLVKTVE